MLACFLLVQRLLITPALAEDPEAQTAPNAAESAATLEDKARLEAAIQLYIAGDLAGARDAILQLLGEENLNDPNLVKDARVWLGEILYTMGDLQAAQSAFEVVALTWPDTRLDPFVHPPEVVAFYDSIAASVAVQRPVDPKPPVLVPRPNPSPLLYAVPGGLQFYNDQPALGGAALSSVAVLGLSSVGLRLWIQSQDDVPSEWGVQVEDDAALVERLKAVRAAENTLGFSALAVWGVSILHGTLQTQGSGKSGAKGLEVTGAGFTVRF